MTHVATTPHREASPCSCSCSTAQSSAVHTALYGEERRVSTSSGRDEHLSIAPPRRLLHEVGEPAQRYRSHQSHPARAHSAARLGCARERLCLQRSDPATVWNGDINGMHGCTMHRTRTAALASVPKLLHQHHCEPNIDGCTQRRRAQSHQHTQASSPLVLSPAGTFSRTPVRTTGSVSDSDDSDVDSGLI